MYFKKMKLFSQKMVAGSIIAALAIVTGCSQSSAPANSPSASASTAPSQSANPSQAMIDGAKKEGKLVVYATGGSTAESVVPGFTKKYPGIDVQVVTLRGPEMTTRIDAEYASGKQVGDIVFTGPGTMLAVRNQNRFMKWDPVDADKVIEGGNDTKGHFWATYLNIYGMLVNTNLLKNDEPKTWKELTDAKYKGKILLDDPRTQGGGQFFMIGASKDPNLGWSYLQSLKGQGVFNRDRNESPRMVARGEYQLYAPQAVNDEVTDILKSGAPVKLTFPQDGAVYIPVQAGVLDKAPHPNAAKLYIEYMLSAEGQKEMVEKGNVFPARKQTKGPSGWPDVTNLKYIPVVTEEDRNKNDEFVKRFEEIYFK